MKLLFASNNQGKVREVKDILKDLGVEVVTPDEVFDGPRDVEETGDTFEANAFLKAKAMGDESGLLTIADDSGLIVDALHGEPGVYSARYESTDEKRVAKILKNMQGIAEKQRTARFVSVMCVYDPKALECHYCRGVVEGTITHKTMGNDGFGYDPIFFSTDLQKTFAQASMAEKNTISHRKRALEQAKNYLVNKYASNARLDTAGF